ncbi:hypothetical protein IFR04_013741 [Cadophora malorum]|uniref:Extracellular membrane protein CFEM domain-containing protein n=1 Tax=Cadophora malorum TaxID=108018 RepID=A0A8H7T457_9HELO|nr:hypothetical protein IFR04_013741 [Cadophora malorum]
MKALSMNSLLVATLIASTSIFRISALPGASPVLLNRAELVLPRQCSWAGHCAGASCNIDDDCSDILTCINRTCGGVAPTKSTPAVAVPTIAAPPAPISTVVSCS